MHDTGIIIDSDCRICGDFPTVPVFPLRDTPLEDHYLKQKIPQIKFPLVLHICRSCGYLHLPHRLDPNESYLGYLYESSTTTGLQKHYDENAEEIFLFARLRPGDFVVDIGSNDGSMLRSFKNLGLKVAGVEPAPEIAKKADSLGLQTIQGYFDACVVEKLIAQHGKPKVVTANFMYANVPDPRGFILLVKDLLDDEGVFVLETGYHPEQFRKNMFDYVYHEHLSYFSVTVLDNLFNSCGLKIIEVIENDHKGGSIRVFATKRKSHAPLMNASLSLFLDRERKDDITSINYFIDMIERIDSQRRLLLKLVFTALSDKKKIVGIGASHSTTTLLYNFQFGEYLSYLVDDNPIKHRTFSPGLHLPVYSSEALYESPPDLLIVLAWQHAEAILRRHKVLSARGVRFVIPLPEFRII